MTSNNISMLEQIAKGFGELNESIAFVGGSVLELYADNAIAEEVRATIDVDVVIKAISQNELNTFEKQIRKLGFQNDISENAPICRWTFHNIKVDIMPSDAKLLGFTNKWYKQGYETKEKIILPNGQAIFLFPLPVYIATKLEAVENRGMKDLLLSHDFEDVIYLFDNCKNIVSTILSSEKEIRLYIAKALKHLEAMSLFREAVLYSMPYSSENSRIERVISKIKKVL